MPRIPFGQVLIIDIETAPDPYAVSLLHRKGNPREEPSTLHRVTAVSMLGGREKARDVWADIGLTTVGIKPDEPTPDARERELLELVDRRLVDLAAGEGTLVSYNGVRHDMPVLRRRAARHQLHGLTGVTGDRTRHLDLMVGRAAGAGPRWSSLRDAAAGLGIPVEHRLPTHGLGPPTSQGRKGQVDVVLTFLLMLHEIALERGDPVPVAVGWRALGDYIRRMGPHGEHLAQFRRHPFGAEA